MMHLPLLPILIPLVAAALLLLARPSLVIARALSGAAVVLGLGASLFLLAATAGGDTLLAFIGDWPAPYGIVLVGDRLSAMMVVLLFVLAVPAHLAASAGTDAAGRHFHPLFQLQLAGIAGAFLTGDVFNLFVFFEILLIASYALLVHGGGLGRVRAGLPYVALNLFGSSLFLVALALLYGTLGTLNMADIADSLGTVPPDTVALVRVAFLLLALVFLLKAAVVPMIFWLPHVYPAAAAPVGALFAVLTKVGIVSLLRLDRLALSSSEVGAGLLQPWLPVLALATIVWGTVGALAARRLSGIAANLVLVSSGTLLFAVADGSEDAVAALLFYLPHSTLVTAGLFLLAGALADARGRAGDWLVRGPLPHRRVFLGIVFAGLAVAVSGLPPLGGFIGKLMLLEGAGAGGLRPWWWAVLLLSGLMAALVLARAASLLFWEPAEAPQGHAPAGAAAPLLLVAAASPAFVLAAAPLSTFMAAAARQLAAPVPLVEAVIGPGLPVERERRP
jgi:multicomponent K+:H+ antiporter subunit D